ncbi:MAG: DUF3899 domain-containing protein [Treponema sp.]|nr:DUF3899 domain-containing protein [Treponema sp.]
MRGTGWKKFLLMLSAFLVALLVMRWESSSYASSGERLALARVWSDGFFVSAALFASIGILSLVSSWGGFDTLAYGATFLAARFTRRDSEHKSYFDYTRAKREERRAKREKGKSLHALDFVITGLVMLSLSIASMLAQ